MLFKSNDQPCLSYGCQSAFYLIESFFGAISDLMNDFSVKMFMQFASWLFRSAI